MRRLRPKNCNSVLFSLLPLHILPFVIFSLIIDTRTIFTEENNENVFTNPENYVIINVGGDDLEDIIKIRYDKAIEAEPKITSDMISIAVNSGAQIQGLEYRLKSEESYNRKAKMNQNIEIKDIIRYTYTASNDKYVETTNNSIKILAENGYKTIKIKNYWLKNDNPYKGVNTYIESPDGQVFELQYHTPESLELKQGKLHELYEKQRLLTDDTSTEYIKLKEEMFDLTDALEIPKNIKEVADK